MAVEILEKKEAKDDKKTVDFPVVGVGASAGGLDSFRGLLESLPADTGLSLVIIQHLAAGQESMLAEILSRYTKMPVQVIQNGMKVKPNHVFVIPPGATVTIENKALKLSEKEKSLKPRPIDDFFKSLATDLKSKSIGIVFSGTGSDGTEGLKAIRSQGGITFAQTPKSAQYQDMPQSAISAGVADFVLSPSEIAKELEKVASNPQLAHAGIGAKEERRGAETKPRKENALNAIFTILKSKYNVDFSHYKETVVNRRISRRMVINHVEKWLITKNTSIHIQTSKKHYSMTC